MFAVEPSWKRERDPVPDAAEEMPTPPPKAWAQGLPLWSRHLHLPPDEDVSHEEDKENLMRDGGGAPSKPHATFRSRTCVPKRLVRMLRAFERWNAKRLLRPARQQTLGLAHAWLEWRTASMFSVLASRSDPANEQEMQAVVERNARLNVSLRSLGNWQAEKEAELEQRISDTMWGEGSPSSKYPMHPMGGSERRTWMLEQKVRRLQLELKTMDERTWSVDFVCGAQQLRLDDLVTLARTAHLEATARVRAAASAALKSSCPVATPSDDAHRDGGGEPHAHDRTRDWCTELRY